MKRVLIGGAAYGWHNIGDDGLLRGIISDFSEYDISIFTKKSCWLADEYPDIEQIEINDLYHKPNFGQWYGKRSSISDWITSLFPDMLPFKKSDLFICGGGTILSACPWHSYRVSMLAKKESTPTILWGVGMCTENNREKINLLKKWLNDDTVLKIYTRDEIVKERLVKIGINADKLSVCYDPAYVLEKKTFNLNLLDNSSCKMYLSNKRKIVLTLSGESDISNQVNLSFFDKFIRNLIEQNYSIFLIPISYGTHTKDIEFAKKLSKIDVNVKYVEHEFKPNELIDFLSNVDLSISSRLHMSIYSAVAGIPFISLKRNDKNSDLAKLFGMPCFEFDNLSIDKLDNAIEMLINNKEKLSNDIKEQVNKYKIIHREKAQEVKNYLNNDHL